ncbi:cbb3-type cytochrome c oxidase N-terminal domain-containing protein, partial [Escherichia coli]|uniref:cbb3-type cytochrome c oxidase N-terminal domain-containing protein n=1 Tax=Escherichia coli TaxID=562 RepID=UPI001962DC4B
MSEKHIDKISGVETTGHEWDGIRELNNPMPRWWVWTFYATIVWAIGYTNAFPARPV